ncbi:MAG: trehalose-6-phosphate synthase [Chloroflexi bacterium]|nr:trehalose-6-phosphate synthase [Chloroflexota bacterium]
MKTKLGDFRLIVVSNREPYTHSTSGDRVVCRRPVSGLTEALDPVMRATGGVWVAQGTGDADRLTVDASDHVTVPPGRNEYTLRRVWLDDRQVKGFYLGFSNNALWPLCHIVFIPPVFDESDWLAYKEVNRVFADAVLEEAAGRKTVVLVQDYHLALLPAMIKERDPGITVGQFWHIPWTPYEVFRTCPWTADILKGLLGNDLLGFHLDSYCRNFIESVDREFGEDAAVDGRFVQHHGRRTAVEAFPISIDFDHLSRAAGTEAVSKEMAKLTAKYNLDGRLIGIGIDRLDYTKGILQRLEALDLFFEKNPEYRGKVVFIQAGMPSRTELASYREIAQRIDAKITAINSRYSGDSWQPIVTLGAQLSPVELNALRRLARFCLVTSLHDGMNLVAKEFVAARSDGDGVLVLSRFAGAAAELGDALIINPFDATRLAAGIREAVEMPPAERKRRMKKMRRVLAGFNIYQWGAATVGRLLAMAGA